MKKFTGLMFNLMVCLLVGMLIGAPLAASAATGVLIGFVPGVPAGSMGFALQKEIWQNDIVKNLFADNSFLSKAFNADQYVLAGKVVHKPQAGTAASVKKNRIELPAAAVKRTDDEITYSLDEYTTDPRLVTDAEKTELSYDKRQSVIGEDKANLVEIVSNDFIYRWSPTLATSMLRTTGAEVDAHLPVATGKRKAITIADVASAAFLMNSQNVPQQGRYALLDAWMYKQLIDAMSATAQRDFLSTANAAQGVLGQLYGFSFYQRSIGAKYNDAATPVPQWWDTEGTVDDNAAGLFWQQDCVERALGEVKMFDNPGQATFYGDVLSFLVRASGRFNRKDQKGVVALIQAIPEGA